MVHQTPTGGRGAVATSSESASRAFNKMSLILYIMMVMVIIGFLSFVPVGETDEHLIEPIVGVFLMIVLMLIMLASWVTKG